MEDRWRMAGDGWRVARGSLEDGWSDPLEDGWRMVQVDHWRVAGGQLVRWRCQSLSLTPSPSG